MDFGYSVFLLDPVDFKGGYMYLFFLYSLIITENIYLAYLLFVRPYQNNILNVIEIGCSLLMTTFMNIGLVYYTLVIFGFSLEVKTMITNISAIPLVLIFLIYWIYAFIYIFFSVSIKLGRMVHNLLYRNKNKRVLPLTKNREVMEEENPGDMSCE